MGSLSTEELYEQTRIPRSSVYRAASILEGLANDTREIVQLAIYENGMVRIVDNVRKYRSIINFNHLGAVIAVINISGHMKTISDDKIEALAARVKQRAHEGSTLMGYAPQAVTLPQD